MSGVTVTWRWRWWEKRYIKFQLGKFKYFPGWFFTFGPVHVVVKS